MTGFLQSSQWFYYRGKKYGLLELLPRSIRCQRIDDKYFYFGSPVMIQRNFKAKIFGRAR